MSSASNLRSWNYKIPLQSEFKNKEMAGNIVPAVATTNAIVAGIQVIEAIKVISSKQQIQQEENQTSVFGIDELKEV